MTSATGGRADWMSPASRERLRRALARFQSVPDDYALPERRALACTVVGNGVHCLLAAAIGHSLRGLL